MAKKFIYGNWFTRLFKPSDRETTYLHKGEILIVFVIGYLIAISLWLLVNLSREYNIVMEVPLQVVGQSEGMAFAEQPPDNARIGVSGEGWNLLPMYRTPPEITIPYDEGVVSITNIIQDQMVDYPELEVQTVQPSFITVEMEPKLSKRVPVEPNLDLHLQPRFEIRGEVRVEPDSVTVTGAQSLVDTVRIWPTELLRLRNVQEKVSRQIKLVDLGQLISKDTTQVNVSFEVTEFTEGEVRVYVQARNMPDGRQVRFNPSVLNIKYDVPIEHFSEAQDIVPYEAYVDYEAIARDTTGFVVPTVQPATDELDLRLRSFQPRRVSYFRIISE